MLVQTQKQCFLQDIRSVADVDNCRPTLKSKRQFKLTITKEYARPAFMHLDNRIKCNVHLLKLLNAHKSRVWETSLITGASHSSREML